MTGINQSFILTGTKGISARVTVQETYDIFANTSDIQVGVEIASQVYGGHIYYLLGSIAAEGQTLQSMSAYAGTHFVYLEKTGTYYPIAAGDSKHTGSPWQLSGIRHDTDGSKILEITLRLTGEEENGSGADDWEIYETIQVLLTRIPRASTIAATDARIGGVSVVAVSRKSEEYTHTIHYQFGSLSGYLTEDGTSQEEEKLYTTGIAFLIPQHFYNQIPDSQSALCTLQCKTYWGDTQIGETQSCSFTVTCDGDACAPQVTGTVKDGNPNTAALTGDTDVLVRYASNAVCTITANGRNGASIVGKQVDDLAVTGNTRTIVAIEKGSVTFSAWDSRGYTTHVTVNKTMIPYVHLSCHPDIKRTDPTSGNAVLTVTGDCFFGSFGAVSNSLQLRYRIGSGDWQEMTLQPSGNYYTARAELTGLDYTRSHTLEVQAEDQLQTVSKTLTLGKGIPVFDWGENDFAFHVPVYLPGLPQRENEAVSKAYADGKLSLVTLWENPDLSGEFPPQMVQMDLGDCDFLFCAATQQLGGKEYQITGIVPNVIGNCGYINALSCDGTDFRLDSRKFTVSYQGIVFDRAWTRDMATGTVQKDVRDRSVPVAVYGLR